MQHLKLTLPLVFVGLLFPQSCQKREKKKAEISELKVMIGNLNFSNLESIKLRYQVCADDTVSTSMCFQEDGWMEKTFSPQDLIDGKLSFPYEIQKNEESIAIGVEVWVESDGKKRIAAQSFQKEDPAHPASKDCPYSILRPNESTSLRLRLCELKDQEPRQIPAWLPELSDKTLQNAMIPPLRTCGRYIVNDKGYRVKLASVNWYGANTADQIVSGIEINSIDSILEKIKETGFNSIRLPFSLAVLNNTQILPASITQKYQDLNGKSYQEAFHWTIDKITSHGLAVILDFHSRDPMWCASTSVGDCDRNLNFFWYSDRIFSPEENESTEALWIYEWQKLVQRYRSNPLVIGIDLYNAIRHPDEEKYKGRMIKVIGKEELVPVEHQWATWAANNPNGWRRAATRAITKLQKVNSELLMFVQGTWYSGYFKDDDIATNINQALIVPRANKVVYAPHEAPDFNRLSDIEKRWGFILDEKQGYNAPIWVGSLGWKAGQDHKNWQETILNYLKNKDVDFALWSLNSGPKIRTDDQSLGEFDDFGWMKSDWSDFKNDERMTAIRSLIKPSEGPGYTSAPCLSEKGVN